MSGTLFESPAAGNGFRGSSVAAGEGNLELSDYERQLAQKLLRPETFLFIDDRIIGYLAERLVLAGLNLPITQVQGFEAFTARSELVQTDETTTSTAYTNLATTGPTLDGLPNGEYLILVGCFAKASGGAAEGARMSIEVNGAAAADADSCISSSTGDVSVMRPTLKTLSSANDNTVVAKYRSTDGGSTATFSERTLVALKYQNI